MKLVGYIEPYKELIFTIPIYTENSEYFFHEVDSSYKISGFYKFNESDSLEKLITIPTNLDFSKGNPGAIIFKGKKDDLIADRLENGIKEVKNYLKVMTKHNQFLSVKEDVSFFESLIPEKNISSTRRTDTKKRLINPDTQYILKYLETNQNEVAYYASIIIVSLFQKVLNSDDQEKAIIEFKRDIKKIKPGTIRVSASRQLRSSQSARKLGNMVRKRGLPQIDRYKSINDLDSKVVMLKTIIEGIEKKRNKQIHTIIINE